MRHVIEHNPHWEKILKNAVNSFNKKMILIIFTPFMDKTQIISQINNWQNTGITMIDIAFKKEDITKFFSSIEWTCEENIPTDTQYNVEHIFYLNKSKRL
jgi:hypothetical protein